MKVIASSIRKGNIIEQDGKLYVVLSAENIHPGKGTPVTQVDMRRIADGVKVSERWRTTEQVERAHVDERAYDFLYEDGEGFHFMEPESYEQVVAPADMVGDQKAYLQEGMRLFLQVFNGVPIAMTLPQRITVEITETEPVVKGQTASSSYKPATCDNGLRVMVPPHIGVGTRIATPSSLPFSSGSTRPTALAAPVEVGIIDSAAARARYRSLCIVSSVGWSPV